MRSVRSLLAAFGLAFALLGAQHAAALHAIAHVTEAADESQEKKAPSPACEQCSAFSQLWGPGPATHAVPAVECAGGAVVGAPVLPDGAGLRLAFHSRAPPRFS